MCAAMNVARKRVCVIGAGGGGLIATSTLRDASFEVELYEKQSSVGGIWRRGGDVVYDGLRCNLPHQIMAYEGVPFEGVTGGRSFALTADCVNYLERFARDRAVEPRFGVEVTRVERVGETWRVESRDDGGTRSEEFEFVVVANGHYERPSFASLDGAHTFPGRQTHSRDYFRPAGYEGKTVVCIGARSSGIDIAKELAEVARRVVVADSACSAREPYDASERLVRCPSIAQLRADGSVLFVDGSVEPDVDEVMHCVGFEYDFPFLDAALGVTRSDRSVEPLFEHMFHQDHDSLVFLGIPHSIAPFPLMQLQAILAKQVFAGLASLPSREVKEESERARRAALARPRDAHHLGERQWAYCDTLLELARLDCAEDATWRRFLDVNKQIYAHVSKRRPPFPGGPDIYRRLEYECDHDQGTWRCLNEQEVDAAELAAHAARAT